MGPMMKAKGPEPMEVILWSCCPAWALSFNFLSWGWIEPGRAGVQPHPHYSIALIPALHLSYLIYEMG